jgi:hypothetical protein
VVVEKRREEKRRDGRHRRGEERSQQRWCGVEEHEMQ